MLVEIPALLEENPGQVLFFLSSRNYKMVLFCLFSKNCMMELSFLSSMRCNLPFWRRSLKVTCYQWENVFLFSMNYTKEPFSHFSMSYMKDLAFHSSKSCTMEPFYLFAMNYKMELAFLSSKNCKMELFFLSSMNYRMEPFLRQIHLKWIENYNVHYKLRFVFLLLIPYIDK